jgi:type IV pilus assembly protein PilM
MPTIGLDIGASSLKVAQLDLAPSTPSLKACGSIAMPSDAIQGNSIKNPQGVADAIRELWRVSGCSARNVCLALPGGSVFVKPITVPRLPWRDLRDQVVLEAAQVIPYDSKSISIDFHVLRQVNEDSVEVLVVAAKNDVLSGYLDAVERAGLSTVVVDVDYFALQNCFEFGEPAQIGSTTALIDIGARSSSLHIVQGGNSLRIADVSLGSESLQESEQDGVPLVRELARQLSLVCSSEEEELAIDSVRVSGGGAVITGLGEGLSRELQLPVHRLNPYSQLAIAPSLQAESLESKAPFFAVAIGLSLRCPGDCLVPEYLG